MTNFELIAKDTETLAKFITMISDDNCSWCIARNECSELIKTSKTTYQLCRRAWCTWLNKQI